ncbi:MAG: hypothetical protein IKB22_04575 [Lentisphaeria bacterium]|nr:hypothetical protein [Lentisphaeria bacterium]
MNDIELIAQNNLEKALQVIEKSNVRQAWEFIGAEVHQGGSCLIGFVFNNSLNCLRLQESCFSTADVPVADSVLRFHGVYRAQRTGQHKTGIFLFYTVFKIHARY